MSKKKAILILSGIVLLAAAIRVLSAVLWHGLTFDEIISVAVASKPLSQMWTYLRFEMHPPLHFLYLKFWMDIFGNSEIVIRLSSIVLSLISISLVYLLSKELFKSRVAALYSSALTSFILIALIYSLVARMYALLFLLATLSLYFFIKAIRNNSAAYWILYTLATLLLLYTHLTALVIPAIQIIILLYMKHKGELDIKIIKKFILHSSVYILLYIPWFIHFLVVRLPSLIGNKAWFFFKATPDVFFLNIPIQLVIGDVQGPFLEIITLIIIIAALVFASITKVTLENSSWHIEWRKDAALLTSFLVLFIPITALFILNLNTPRFYILSALGLVLIMGFGLHQIQEKISKIVAISALVVLLFPIGDSLRLPDPGYTSLVDFVEEREQTGDVVISAFPSDLFAFDYYYKGNTPTDTLADPEFKQKYQDALEFTMWSNTFVYAHRDNIDQMSDMTIGHDRVFFVFSENFGPLVSLFADWFMQNGWRKIDSSIDYNWSVKQAWLLERI